MIDIIYTQGNIRHPENGDYHNKLILNDDDWNDGGIQTLFHLSYADPEGAIHIIGPIKIYHEADYSPNTSLEKKSRTIIKTSADKKIGFLPEDYCSLGQNLAFYQNLVTLIPNETQDVLLRLRDMATSSVIKDRFSSMRLVKRTLLRDSSAYKAYNAAQSLLENQNAGWNSKNMSFQYSFRAPYDTSDTTLNFDFQRDAYLPYRINILIGKNGVGKTQLLKKLAESLSGISSYYSGEHTEHKRPPFDKIIAISYSAFDSFMTRREEDTHGIYKEIQGYVYCGIHSENRLLTTSELRQKFHTSLDVIKEKGRMEKWEQVMQELLEREHKDLLILLREKEDVEYALSSGQYFLISSITEAIANIENESIILFDEPELHLHPNAMSNLMRMLYRLLEEFDSYAILATHSPLIVQETPSRYIQILTRMDNNLFVRHPELECFGENITQITNEVFDVSNTESNYRTLLTEMSKKLSYEQVLQVFHNQLSFNAATFLNNCYKR